MASLMPGRQDAGQYEADAAEQKGLSCHTLFELTKCCAILTSALPPGGSAERREAAVHFTRGYNGPTNICVSLTTEPTENETLCFELMSKKYRFPGPASVGETHTNEQLYHEAIQEVSDSPPLVIDKPLLACHSGLRLIPPQPTSPI
ncbi:hypothetical protein EYF80_038630 [Liparis tanakae]|uniref:Uncharacterized protein n=1 Tax=Liparis tanakae TaxID=230148 RepID=A0A4Z2GD26_9TELE|nr:hypothetical protein EYF80_038630 [Liparis tanakae]